METLHKKTLVIGASPKPVRYSNKAIRMLREYGHEVVALAKRAAQVEDVNIQTELPENEKVHTVTMYLTATRQPEYYNLLLKLKPKRVIFNPGAENRELNEKLEAAGIETVEGCTLVMLRTGQF
ncbi:CoA-binding protein [Mariniphaga sediminis]|uniref:CoA-binding protein n=1 Tax=Mariniphaga sediminis TaxID=1628158 RepID=A0A399D5P6_9BACT|nr:CoA-binding protein [Mariniphaga sediminis]RIH67215.1 CoA-binding protein [Mariniphaga sediminis]